MDVCGGVMLAFETAAAATTRVSLPLSDVPNEITPLSDALLRLREYTLALYRDLPEAWWVPAQFPQLDIVNPPLWELAHIAWFQEFFCLRWHAEDMEGARTPSSLDVADRLLNSSRVPHGARWTLPYPAKQTMLDYMARSLDNVLDALQRDDGTRRGLFQLALMHEHMHTEALLMTREVLKTLDLAVSLEDLLPERLMDIGVLSPLSMPSGETVLGDSSGRTFQFDNELAPLHVQVKAFEIDAQPVAQAAFDRFKQSAAYVDDRHWSDQGAAWRNGSDARAYRLANDDRAKSAAAIHVNFFEAEAYCHAHDRRLPTEAEWEFACVTSPAFAASTGEVWEWTATRFAPRAGFVAGAYADYSVPWFGGEVPHMVLKGGSFATHPRLKYPQYRNFFLPPRDDVFAGFRTCAT